MRLLVRVERCSRMNLILERAGDQMLLLFLLAVMSECALLHATDAETARVGHRLDARDQIRLAIGGPHVEHGGLGGRGGLCLRFDARGQSQTLGFLRVHKLGRARLVRTALMAVAHHDASGLVVGVVLEKSRSGGGSSSARFHIRHRIVGLCCCFLIVVRRSSAFVAC